MKIFIKNARKRQCARKEFVCIDAFCIIWKKKAGDFRKQEKKIAQLQKRGHKKQAKFVHRKVKRQRVYALHTFTTNLIRNYKEIYIGDVSFNFMKSGNGAKRAYDNASSMIKTMLAYKGQQAMRHVKVINESYTTRACSACGCLSGPTGRTGLVVREWQCVDCGTIHDRDVNASVNILKEGKRILGIE